MQQRWAGVLLHPTALPGGHGIGDLGPGARAFLAWLDSAGQSVWQVMPLGPTGHGDSPYGTTSAFAGNPLLISADDLVVDGLLPLAALEALGGPGSDVVGDQDLPVSGARVDFNGVRDRKDRILRETWRLAEADGAGAARAELEVFANEARRRVWLDDWALFGALKTRFDQASWMNWPEELRRRDPEALSAARRELADEVRYQTWVQFLFHRQWSRLRAEAERRGVRLFGDVPIYVIADSADVWAHQDLFALDEAGRPSELSGCPPDAFSEDGQLWGQPIYRWDRMRETGYDWWVERMRAAFEQADISRLDHFRGFAGYWSVPASAETAREGRWVRGPGHALFEALGRELGAVELVAEDLGVITPDVIALRDDFDLAGMKVLQFGFGEIDSPHLPHNHDRNAVVYTGTHDNDTTSGWYASLDAGAKHLVHEYLSIDGSNIVWDLIRTAHESVAKLTIVPVQDVLELGSEARFNTPGVGSGNWAWRLDRLPGEELARRLARLTELSGRLPVSEADAARKSDEARRAASLDYFDAPRASNDSE